MNEEAKGVRQYILSSYRFIRFLCKETNPLSSSLETGLWLLPVCLGLIGCLKKRKKQSTENREGGEWAGELAYQVQAGEQ